MRIKQLLDKLSGILDEERKVQLEKYKSLKKVLKALRTEKTDLELSLEKTEDEETQHNIESRLKVISAQRKKGLKLMKDLKKERKGETAS
ncbi:MAG: hypothetical protein OEU84_09255 [Xanthomonadales bacterium]|nr:hypothetical protein [Xanthomonadales bacterium]MDH4019776.1 hypothetical protein [Xanthomonadales bacterium]